MGENRLFFMSEMGLFPRNWNERQDPECSGGQMFHVKYSQQLDWSPSWSKTVLLSTGEFKQASPYLLIKAGSSMMAGDIWCRYIGGEMHVTSGCWWLVKGESCVQANCPCICFLRQLFMIFPPGFNQNTSPHPVELNFFFLSVESKIALPLDSLWKHHWTGWWFPCLSQPFSKQQRVL